jgi:hypothetical protein
VLALSIAWRQAEDWRTGEGWAIVVVAALTLAGLAVRLASFGDSLFGDELSAYYVVTAHSLGEVLHLLSNHSTELNPPLYFVLAWFSEKLFGDSAEALKLVSLLAGTATIPLTYALGRRIVGVRTAVVGCALVALCPFLIFYSTEARPYALMVVLVLLSTLALLRATRSGGVGWWTVYAVLACAAAYTHFTAVFALAGQLLWALVTQPRAWRAALIASIAAAIAYLPWLPILIRTSKSPGTKLYAFLEPFSLTSIRIDLGRWAIGHPYVSLSVIPGLIAAALALAAIAVTLVGLAISTRSRRGPWPRPSRDLVLVIVLAGATPLGDALYSTLRESVWFARNLTASWPAFALLTATLVTRARPGLRAAATGLLLAAFTVGAISMIPQSHHRPDYQAAIAYIDGLDRHGGPIADLVAPTPGPPSETDAALALSSSTRAHPVFRIGAPPLDEVLASAPYAPLYPQPGEVVARDAATAAGHGLLFIIAPTPASIADLEATRRRHIRSTKSTLAIFRSFLGALPARFHPMTARTFTGFVPVTVYVYRG